jgi:Flp pilus assembly protein TadD
MIRFGRAVFFCLLVLAAGVLAAGCRSQKVIITPAEEYEQQGDQAYFQQDTQGAIDHYQNALQAGARTTALHNNLGNAYFRERRFNAAEQSYLDALELDPEYLFSLNNLALTLYHAGDREEAKKLIGKAKTTYPHISFLHTTDGYFRFLEGDRKGALASFRKAIKVNPGSPAALNNLGVLYLEDPDLGVDPIPYLTRAAENAGENKLFHDSLGWYYYGKGMFAKATIEIGKAFAYDPQNTEVRVHYATVLEWETVLEQAEDAGTRKLALEHVWEIRGRGGDGKEPG